MVTEFRSKQLVVGSDQLWVQLVAWLESQGWVAALMPDIEDDLPTYVVQPGPERLAASKR